MKLFENWNLKSLKFKWSFDNPDEIRFAFIKPPQQQLQVSNLAVLGDSTAIIAVMANQMISNHRQLLLISLISIIRADSVH